MLKKLRKKKTAKRIWIILIVLITPAFIFWGFGSFIRSKQEASYLGAIFGRKVTFLEYKDALDAVRNQAIIQFGDDTFPEIEKNLNLEILAWERLLLLAEAKIRKVTASDAEVIELIRSYPLFKTKNGQFDHQIYSQYLEYVFHAQPRIFEEQTRQNLIISKLYKAVTDSLNVSEETVKEEYKKMNEQIGLYYIASIPSDFVKDIIAPEEEVKDYFAKNSFQFKEPISFNIEYISLTPEEKDEEIIKDKIKRLISRLKKIAFGDNLKVRFLSGFRKVFYTFLHQDKKESFAKVAKEFNLEVKETGLFSQVDPIPGIGWSPQILNLISKLRIGEFSPPIHIDKNYYILRLKEKKESYIPDFQAIKEKVKERFIKDKSRGIAKEKIENCLKKLKELYPGKSIDFDKVAKLYGLKSDSTQLFKYGSYIEGIGASDNFFTVAQNLKEDEFSEIIDMPSGFYIIKLKSKIPVDEKKFKEEKDEFTKRLLMQKRVEYFSKFLEELKRRVRIF